MTPLLHAATSGHVTAVRTLLQVGAKDPKALHTAATKGQSAALEALLEFGLEANARDDVRRNIDEY
jgi:Ankyrin repeats (3 copies)